MKIKIFTLVEMLVIVGIMAVLASILAPVFARGISKAHMTACGSNLRQISLAFQLYKSDTRDYPAPYRWLDDFSALEKYVQTPRIFRCPARKLPPITSMSALNAGTDYLFYTGFDFLDIELKSKKNNGHGNNAPTAYGTFDPSNPPFARALALKSKVPRVYDKSGPIHFKGINATQLYDSRIEYRSSMQDLWTLDSKGELNFKDTSDFPTP